MEQLTTEPWALDAVGQAELVRRGEVSAAELVEATIERIERADPVLHVMAARGYEQARARAREGAPRGPLGGVPFLVKDLLPYPGMACAFGSRLMQGRMATEGPPYAQALDEAGVIVVGKTTTSEFGLLGTTEPWGGEATRNPWALDRSAAGSSGGSAAAVAAGVVPMAHGSDGGGSLRIPASMCGVFGFKPSRGRNRSNGMSDGVSVTDMIVEHAISRSVRDSATLLSVTQRTDPQAPFAPLSAARPAGSRRLRIAWHERTAWGRSPGGEVSRGLSRARALCEELGHDVIETAGPSFEVRATSDAYFAMGGAMLAGMVGQIEAAAGQSLTGMVEPFTRALIERGRRSPPGVLGEVQATFEVARGAALAFLREYDVVLCPTTPLLPFALGRHGPGEPVASLMGFIEEIAAYTAFWSIAGAPAMSVPLHWTGEGLPVGMQFVAAPGDEATLFALAYALEEAAPWAGRWGPWSLPRQAAVADGAAAQG